MAEKLAVLPGLRVGMGISIGDTKGNTARRTLVPELAGRQSGQPLTVIE
jgi:hypothetical protein